MRRIRAVAAHAFLALLEGALIAALIVGLVAGTALAGKGGKPGGGGHIGTSGLTVVMVKDQNGDKAPNWNDWITFTFSTTETRPQIDLLCYQPVGSTNLVYASNHLMYTPNFWDDDGVFWLSSPAWSSGAASCTANLKGVTSNNRVVILGTLSFTVAA